MPKNQGESSYRQALTRLIRHLTTVARELKEYNAAVDVDPGSAAPPPPRLLERSGVAEVDAVSASLSAAMHVLTRHVEQLRRFVPQAASISPGGGSDRRAAAVLHCALEERKSETLRGDADAAVDTLRKFSALVSLIVDRHGGFLHPSGASGILGIFGFGGEGEPGVHACECAMEIVAAIDQLNAYRAHRGQAPVRCGVGISTGEILIARVPLGDTMVVNISGEPIHVAARLQTMALEEVRPLLLDEPTVSELGDGMPTAPRENLAVLANNEISGVHTVNRPPPHVDLREELDALFGPEEPLPEAELDLEPSE